MTISNFSAKNNNEKEVISLHSSGSSEKKNPKSKEGGLKQSSLDNFMLKGGKRKLEKDVIDLESSDPGTIKKTKVVIIFFSKI